VRISHIRRFVFLAVPRTGSTTVRELLNPYSEIRSIHISEISDDFPFYHHISAQELKTLFEERDWPWDDYEKFCFVRNPYDRVVSLYHHHLKMRRRNARMRRQSDVNVRIPPFNEYVMRMDPTQRLPTSLRQFVCDKVGNLLVDSILKFENMREELSHLSSRLDLQLPVDGIPLLNASEERQDYRKYYDEQSKERVQALYDYEFSMFGYSF